MCRCMDLRDEMVKTDLEKYKKCQTGGEVKEWKKTLDANKTARNKDFLEACECLKK